MVNLALSISSVGSQRVFDTQSLIHADVAHEPMWLF